METDVLVIGGGGAGLCAALAAAETGARTTLISKPGGSSTVIAAGGFLAVRSGGGRDSVERFVEDALRSGGGLADPELLALLAEGSGGAVDRLKSWGVSFYTLPDGGERLFRSGGHSVARSVRCASGRGADAYRVLLERARAAGVQFVTHSLVTRLEKRDGRVTGASGMDGQGRPLRISARCTVLATGGLAALYDRTTNTPGMTGEGYILARRAGCRLRDMEFVQFMPTTLAYPPSMRGRLVNDALRGEGARLYNGDMEPFMTRYDPAFGDMAGRDAVANAIARELAAGRGSPHGGVYLDARGIPPEALRQSFGFAGALTAAGVDPARQLMEVTPAAHFTCGGAAVDRCCRTGVPGLYAVGEVTGGLHGANRLGTTALTENVVFGMLAGRLAGEESARVLQPALPAEPESSGEPSPELDEALERGEADLRRLMWRYGGVLRDAEGLTQGRRQAAALRRSETLVPGGSFAQRQRQARLDQLAELAGLVLEAAEARIESRGCHNRLDYPRRDESQTASRFF